MYSVGETLLLFCLPLPPPPTTQHHLARNKGSIIPVAEETDFFYFSRTVTLLPTRKGKRISAVGEGEENNSAKSRAVKNFFFFCSSWRKSIHPAPFFKIYIYI